MPKAEPVQPGTERGGSVLADLWRDLRYAARTMRQNSLFTLFVIVTLGLGIGANTTVFTVVNTLVLNPLPLKDPSSLAGVSELEAKQTGKSGASLPLSLPNLKDIQAKNQTFESLAGYTGPRVVTLQAGGGAQRMFSEFVTGNYFQVLGLAPAAGRFFSPEEDNAPGASAVAVMSNPAWQGRFGGAPDVIGKVLRINGTAITVIGVAPPHFLGVTAIFGPDLWIPAAMVEQMLPNEMAGALHDRGKDKFEGIGRLRPGVNLERAAADLATLSSALAREYPNTNAGRVAGVRPLAEVIFGGGASRSPFVFGSIILLAVVGMVLLIACSNVANLLLARAAARRQEMAVRVAIGASRERLLRQLLTESIVLGLAGGVVGLIFGYAGAQFLWSFRPADVANNLVTLKTGFPVFTFVFLISVLTGLIFGVIPALRATRAGVSEALKEESRSSGRGRRRTRLANGLLAGQVAFSFVALTAAALFLRSIQHAYAIQPGFETKHLAVFLTNPGQAGYGEAQTKDFYREVRERVSRMPEVESTSWASNLPLWGSLVSGLNIEGRQARSKADTVTTILNVVDADYFATAGVALKAGRDFSSADTAATIPVAIVNEKIARDYWPGEEAAGKHIQLPGEPFQRQVIGVARMASYTSLGEAPQLCVYVPASQHYSDSMTLFVRAKRDASGVLLPVQKEIREIAPRIAVDDIRTGGKIVDQALFTAKLGVALLSVFGLLALGLASTGLYGLMAYSVFQRRREIGLRMALGAERRTVVSLVVKQGMSLVATGLAAGLAAALVAGHFLAGMLYGVGAADPVSIGSAAVVLLGAALLACYLPARRASRLDPLEALREG